MYKKLSHYILRKYEAEDYLIRHKAGLIMFIPLLLITVLIIGTMASFAVSLSRVIQFLHAAIPISIVSILTLVLLKKGRLQMAANIFVSFCSVVVIVTFLMKPPHLGYVTLAYFMFLCLLFAALFTSKLITTLILAGCLIADVVYYTVHSGSLQGFNPETFKTGLIDSIAVLILMYFIALLTISMLQNAIKLINEEKEKNYKHYMEMSNVHTTIHRNTNNLSQLADEMSSTAATFSANLSS